MKLWKHKKELIAFIRKKQSEEFDKKYGTNDKVPMHKVNWLNNLRKKQLRSVKWYANYSLEELEELVLLEI